MAKKVDNLDSNQISMFDFIEFSFKDIDVIDAIVLVIDTTSKKPRIMEVPFEIYSIPEEDILNFNKQQL